MNRYGCGFVVILMVAERCFAGALPIRSGCWDADPMQWRIEGETIGAKASGSHGVAFFKDEKPCRRILFSATVKPEASSGKGFATAGIGFGTDEANFWHVALVQAPPEAKTGRYCELVEMKDGTWLSQLALRQTENQVAGSWRYGESYTLRIGLEENGTWGEILDAAGNRLFRRAFQFSAVAVDHGRPLLHLTGGMRADFTRPDAVCAQPVPVEQPVFPPYTCDSYVADIRDRATGFFHVVQKSDGRWWTIDPLGRGMVMLGIDHVTMRGHGCEKLGWRYLHYEAIKDRYPDKAAWERETLERLTGWGFNLLGAGCDAALKHRGMAHTVFLSFGDRLCQSETDNAFWICPNEHRPCSAFPNVFHPDFDRYCVFYADRLCAPHANDPWLFGYFIDNELAWWGRGAHDTGLFDAAFRLAATHTAKKAACELLKERAGGDLAAFNRTWSTDLKGWDGLPVLTALPSATEEQRACKRAFLRLAAERYFGIATQAIRRADPNHLVLGARFAGTGGAHQEVWEVAGKYCDIVTFNCYPWADLDRNVVLTGSGLSAERIADHFTTFFGTVKRPMLVTEWSFPALDSGLPCTHGAGQRFYTQAERTQATELFARTMLSLPFLLGYDYFMWVDQPPLGISEAFPEDSNYGLLSLGGTPYPEITAMFTRLQREAGKWRREPVPAEKPAPSVTDTLRAADCVAALRRDPGAGSVRYARDGDTFRVSNGAGLQLEGKVGDRNMIGSVTVNGKPVGAYNAMLQTDRGWSDTTRVMRVDGREEAGCAVLDITAENPAVGFTMTHRITVLPDQPLFLCELIRLDNSGKAPLAVRSFFFRYYSPFSDLPKSGAVPNLWKGPASAVWLDQADGRYFGTATFARSVIRILFWKDAERNYPDAQLGPEKPFTLQPGESYTPNQPMYVFSLAGTGGEAEFAERVKGLQALEKRLR